MKKIKDLNTGETCYFEKHKSGLPIYLYPKNGYTSTYAVIGTRYGSINTQFLSDGRKIEVPDGIAHYLEHKLFESEDGDAFSKFAKTGANANAFTSFDQTCYLFNCTDNFEQSLEILLDFVQAPYFTDESVQKEQGIIAQEINMYKDDPSWQVMFNLLNALYINHPVKIDIAGSVESIAQITPSKLYECYNSYYNLNNMVLCVSGNADMNSILKIADKVLKPVSPIKVENVFPEEPSEINKDYVEESFSVSTNMFELGFKEKCTKERKNIFEIACTDVILATLASKISPLYNDLMDKKLINSTFSYEYFEGPGYASVIFSGESENPKEVANLIKESVEKLHEKKIDIESFNTAKKAIYGKAVRCFDNIEFIGNATVNSYFSGVDIFEYATAIGKLTLEDVNTELEKHLDVNCSALSVITPLKGEK